ncbi:interferon-induced protein 44-like [Denticeps clupeoides]|uniref:interferon-induced protein 44-like n=1 Tax=Denticeps clupeoides TaxID=299321 RepID=UPI0010A50CC3|nr:interferon-induced protein 44-like [Denticeps clupeoides]XP_028833267.1 interferon-induced protein 44-like [Denticeps clupeoides]
MSAVKSNLSKEQERMLCSMFDRAKLSLLFKASVHGYSGSSFHQKCDNQGPTITVAYNNSGLVYGGYVSKDFAQTGQDVYDEKAFLFSLDCRSEDIILRQVPVTNGQPAFNDGAYSPNFGSLYNNSNNVFSNPGNYFDSLQPQPQCSFYNVNTGPNFGGLVFLNNNGTQVSSKPGTFYNFDPALIHGNDLNLIELEVYRVEDSGNHLEKPWRNIDWSPGKRKELMETIKSWKPIITSVSKAQVLLVGPVGAGKSSFFNSLSSVFRGHVTSQAVTGSAGTSVTTKFHTYPVMSDKSRKPLPLILCDTMGLEGDVNAGLDMEDITSILQGHVQDRYQFNPLVPLQEEAPGFRKAAYVKDKIHCLVYVIDSSKVKLLPEKMLEKFAAIRRKANLLGIPQLVLLTMVDEACSLVAENLQKVYQSLYIEKMMREAAALLGVSLSAVIPVKNYSRELELHSDIDVLLLSAVIQIIRAAESYFDDIYQDAEEETT